MDEQEINKTIAEYMRLTIIDEYDEAFPNRLYYHAEDNQVDWIDCYTKSLDALVPVIEKLEKFTFEFDLDYNNDNPWQVIMGMERVESESPSLALATCCAKVINQINT